MAGERRKLGEILVGNGIISEKTMQRALEKALKQNRKLGCVLEGMGVITSDELAEALASQFGYRMITNLDKYSFAPGLLRMISVDTAMRFLLFPLALENGRLSLAIADPTEGRIIANIADNHAVTVVPFMTTRSEIISSINKHYLGKEKAAVRVATVLIAEDSPVTGAELSKTLTAEGYRVVLAPDGIQAFRLAISESPHVIITDKEMPNFGGYRLLESMKGLHETRQIPVILLTGSANSEEEADAFKKGFFDFICKPVKDVTLITRVKRAIQSYEEARRLE